MSKIQRKISTLKLLQKAIYTVALFLLVLLLLIQVSIKIGIYIFKKVGTQFYLNISFSKQDVKE